MPCPMWFWGWWWVPLAFIALMVVCAVFMGGRMMRSGMMCGISGMGAPGESALDVLKKRYAKGEISREQFEQMKRDLE